MQTFRNIGLIFCTAALIAAAASIAALSIAQFINPASMAGVGAVSAGPFEALAELVIAVSPAIVLNFALARRSSPWGNRAIVWRRTHLVVTAVLCAAVVAGQEIPSDFDTALKVHAAGFAVLMATQMAFGIIGLAVVLRSSDKQG
jgi:hypothetical protein